MTWTQAPGLDDRNALELALVMLQHAELYEQTAIGCRVEASVGTLSTEVIPSRTASPASGLFRPDKRVVISTQAARASLTCPFLHLGRQPNKRWPL